MAPRVLMIILCYNGVELTRLCLDSLRRLRYPCADVLVVDNASQDATVATVRAEYPEAVLIETGANLGFAAGNNVGLRYALAQGYDYALLLNNDTEVAPDLLDRLVAACEADPTVAVAGPTIYYHDQPQVIWSAGGGIDWRRGRSFMLGLDTPDQGLETTPRAVAFVTGCALLVRCAALRAGVGLLDERFGMYYEETEWCVRITRAGWRCVYVPTARMWHKIQPQRQAVSPRIIYYMTRNRLLFLRLTHAPLSAWLHVLLLQDGRTWCSWRLRRRWRGQGPQRAALSRAWRDFVCRRFGMIAWE